jgi:hypothetical protein
MAGGGKKSIIPACSFRCFFTFGIALKVETLGKSNTEQLFPGPRTTVFLYSCLGLLHDPSGHFFKVFTSGQVGRGHMLLAAKGCSSL